MNYTQFTETLPSDLRKWVEDLLPEIGKAMEPERNGHMAAWQAALREIPSPESGSPVLDQALVSDGTTDMLEEAHWQTFHPWRKGPYLMGSLEIDTEWQSDWKWERLKPALDPLKGRRCLDVGCGNGYHLWRMLGEGAELALGLDPFLLYVYQFFAVHKRIPHPGIAVLPLGADVISPGLNFDTVFSMGVLYHAKDVQEHLTLLRQALRPGGQLVLETLTVPEESGPEFTPPGRYAQMRNIGPLPSVDRLTDWVDETGFTDIRLIDTTVTTTAEQHSTPWMTFHSLKDFLNPTDSSRTIEGHPAPRRSVLTAHS